MNNNIKQLIDNACQQIAPAWPLENSVAVNPFLGFSNHPMNETAQLFQKRSDIQLYMPLSFYLERIENKEISTEDIKKALQKNQLKNTAEDFIHKTKNLEQTHQKEPLTTTIIQFVDAQENTTLKKLMVQQVALWLASHFNKLSDAPSSPKSLFQSWKADAQHDLLPELSGIKSFRQTIAKTNSDDYEAIISGLETLGIPEAYTQTYLHGLLLSLIGWASYCSGVDWQNNIYEGNTNHTFSLLAILISWEVAIHAQKPQLQDAWQKNIQKQIHHTTPNEYITHQGILQDAYDWALQRQIKNAFETANTNESSTERPLAQMIFCIDVRSEVYRRQIELINPQIETMGFAGFFGFPISYQPMTHKKGKNQCPVLLPSGPVVCETAHTKETTKNTQNTQQQNAQLNKSWMGFKLGSVSSYSFVSPLGIYYLPKLIGDSLGTTRPIKDPKKEEFGQLISGKHQLDLSQIPFENQLQMAQGALTGMGFANRYAPLVLITGHGSSSVNNPHASGLDCGACGGNSGEINALTAQLILNQPKIRETLKPLGISIPEDTLFWACLHDTTTDEITIINEKEVPATHQTMMQKVKDALDQASKKARTVRAPRLNIQNQIDQKIFKRANNWAEIRPEWGLSGCHSFVVAPRHRTKGINLEGKSFLHSYNWKNDIDFKVLEIIMTAPMIVTSWINLQYYASTVDNQHLGAGNKTLHNVTAGLGVVEGSGGDLRIGLPWQSIHDGTKLQHLPHRLHVLIEAPTEAINKILEKHPQVKALCDNAWIKLITLNEQGKMSQIYDKNLIWETL